MRLMPLLGCAALMCAAAVHAETAPTGITATPPGTAQVKPLTPQQERMRSCNADAAARHLQGADRGTFMQSCLSGKPGTAAATTPQQRMKDCNRQASAQQLDGAARRAFLSSCLKGA